MNKIAETFTGLDKVKEEIKDKPELVEIVKNAQQALIAIELLGLAAANKGTE